ncbi:acyl-CoA dehydrogenase [Salinisphaera orenii MK-B5]|uniref:Acyl-CoA dehydrogenase n=2 Tax=Salinisphaera TaxID=180541 RepID=A0A423PH07_9GAMM|nr:acyl-CoA dehydrogenase family protein [Salinisphaera orenii]ROO24908.1 acyl-CoA dehydrogenase [Salinisphaera orenii MK-B5]
MFTHEHDEIRRTTERFIEEQVNPQVRSWENAGIFPAHELFKGLGDLGLLGITKPEEYGGLGLDYSYQLAFAESLGRMTCGGIPMAVGVQTDMATPALARYGSDELKRDFLAPAIAGDQVACIGVSEPGAGSDVAGITTTARREGDDYVINGQKMWITNGTQGDWICLLCVTGGESKHSDKSLIVVPLDAPGVNRETRLDKLGQRSSDTAIIFFDDVRVPARYLIGEAGQGFVYQMQQFQEERLFLAASILEAMQRVFDDTVTYTRERRAFGQSVIDNQYVQFTLAELATELEAARALTYQATADLVAGRDVTRNASMAKLKTSRLARQLTDTCLQFWGGQGYMAESTTAQFYRDLRLHSIGGGADEIMLQIIAKRLDLHSTA